MTDPQCKFGRGRAGALLGLAVVVLTVAALRLCVGHELGLPEGNPFTAALRLISAGLGWPTDEDGQGLRIIDIRLKRLVMAVLVGAALSASGVGLQALLRNPLAEPFILGLSSGAAVGIMVQSWVGRQWHVHAGPPHVGALAGALVNMAVVYTAGRRRGVIDPIGLLLVGVVLATVNGAVIMLLNYLSDSGEPERSVTRWMMGQLDEGAGATSILVVAALVVAGVGLLYAYGPSMDVATFSDAEATSLGVNLRRLRLCLYLICGGLASSAVVLAGPIAFVGLICPHLARLLLGPAHRSLLIVAVLIGAVLLLVADIASVTLDLGRGQIPLGIFTALLGGPVFVAMLRPHLGRGSA
jgi:iron complex transport system permease protein